MAEKFETKDSGQRIDLANGMVRDTSDGKPDYTLLLDGPLFERWAQLLTRGAVKYGKRNWCKALAATDRTAREETTARFKESAFRHMMQWLQGDRSEDHAAAVLFNMNGYEAMRDGDQPIVKLERHAQPVQASFKDITFIGFIDDDFIKAEAPIPLSKQCRDKTCPFCYQDAAPDARTKVELLDKELEQGFGQSAYKPGSEPR